jgi:hypothetical protein
MDLKQSAPESKRGNLNPSLREDPESSERFFAGNLCFLTQDVHWVKNSSGGGVCRQD